MAQIALSPPSATVSPFAKFQFSAVAFRDVLGTALNPQPPFTWSARGGTVMIQMDCSPLEGLRAAISSVNVSNNSFSASANVNILPNPCLGWHLGYIWVTV